MNKIVARYQDGRLIKGVTTDFMPNKETFHVAVEGAPQGAKLTEVRLSELKGVFFVKDFSGDPGHDDRKEFPSSKPVVGRKIQVVFKDGEVMVGTTTAYQPGRPGFFLVPADVGSNNERCYIVSAAAREVTFL